MARFTRSLVAGDRLQEVGERQKLGADLDEDPPEARRQPLDRLRLKIERVHIPNDVAKPSVLIESGSNALRKHRRAQPRYFDGHLTEKLTVPVMRRWHSSVDRRGDLFQKALNA
jgi:hypothetical protein